MHFLLNDRVLHVSPQELTPPLTRGRFSALNFEAVRELGQELFAESPMLQHSHPERAERLAILLLAKAGRINAAQFICPSPDCDPEDVAVRFAELDFMVLADLQSRQDEGRLSADYIYSRVWGRLAAA